MRQGDEIRLHLPLGPAMVLTGVAATLFGIMGGMALARPSNFLAALDLRADSKVSRNEIRAVYGGFGIAICLLLLGLPWLDQLRTGVLITLAVALTGMAAGRVVSALVDWNLGRFPAIFTAIELGLAAALFYEAHA
jgi:Domain of unknown function (DUF4345)